MAAASALDKQWAKLYGILAGDGCIGQYGNQRVICITGHLEDDEPFFRRVVAPLIESLRGEEVSVRERSRYGKREIHFSDKEMFEKIRSLGFPLGEKEGLKISDVVPRKLYTHVIAGYFATDGCLVLTDNNGCLYPRLEIQSRSPQILRQTYEYLLDKGLHGGGIYRMKREAPAKGGTHIMYRMQLNGEENTQKFREVIGFINPKHQEKFKHYTAEVA